MPNFDEGQRWVVNNGFAVVIALALLLLLRLVIIDAVGHFNRRLDDLTAVQSAAVRDLTGSIQHLDHTLDKVATTSAANHEVLTIIMQFMSRTTTEVVAHRERTENGGPPATGVIKPVEGN